MRWAGALIGGVSSLFVAMLAFADRPVHPIDLRWTAPASCPEASTVRRRIQALLAGANVGRPLQAVVGVTGARGAYEVEMRLVGEAGEGERRLEAASCAEIVEATALVVALAYDPDAVAANQAMAAEGGDPAEGDGDGATGPDATGEDAADPEEAGGPRILPMPPVVPAPPPPPDGPRWPVSPSNTPRGSLEDPSRLSRWRVVAAVTAGGELGALPRAAAMVGGRLSLRFHPLALGLRGSYLPSLRETVPERSAGGDFDRWTLGPVVCASPWRTRRAAEGRLGGLGLSACLGLELGQMRGRGFGVRNPDEGSALWVSPSLEGGAAVTIAPWLEAQLGLGMGLPLLRPDFVLERVGVVHRASGATGRAALDLSVVF